MNTALTNKERLAFRQVSNNLFMNCKRTKPAKIKNKESKEQNKKKIQSFEKMTEAQVCILVPIK